MSIDKMFETATREKLRFPFKGQISVEDLWDLSIENLDSIFKILNAQLKQTKEESLLQVKTAKDKELDTKIEIIKYVVRVKLEEKAANLQAKENKDKRGKILEILESKQDADLRNKTQEELTKMLEEL